MGGGGTEKLLGDVRLRGGEAVSDDSNAARRGKASTVAVAAETLAGDKLGDAALQLLGGGGDHARGNFFGTDL